MTRRALLSLPFIAPLAKALGVKMPAPEAKVSDARTFLRSIGCPDGWVPYRINGALMHPVYNEFGNPVAAVNVTIRPLGWHKPVNHSRGMLCVPSNAIAPRRIAEFQKKLDAARIFAEAEY